MEPKDYAGWVAIILAIALGLVLITATTAEMFADKPLTDSGARLLTTIGVGLVGALATYVGTSVRRGNGGNNGEADNGGSDES
jgi:hypothetical protein